MANGKWLLGLGVLALAGCGTQTASLDSGRVDAQAKAASGVARYLVVYKADRLPPDAAARVSRAGGKFLKGVAAIGVATVVGDARFAAGLARDPAVLSVGRENFYKIPELAATEVQPADGPVTGVPRVDDLYSLQWNLRRIKAPAAWDRMPLAKQAMATVAVLDSGVLVSHPDLVGRVRFQRATNYCLEAGGKDSAHPVYSRWLDYRAELDPENPCSDAPSTYYEAHGTHVAGTVGAKFGGGRVVGVAPGVGIAAYKVFDRLTYMDGDEQVDGVAAFDGPIFEAIVDAAIRKFDVINMSLGGYLDRSNKDDNASIVAWDRVMKFANRMGTVVVASAGNAPISTNGTTFHIPSDLPSILSVSATGVKDLVPDEGLLVGAPGSDVIAFYSTYGASTDIAAPGGDCGTNPANGISWCVDAHPEDQPAPADYYLHLILSTTLNDTTGVPEYAFYAGTSMASPHVAAVAALVKAQNKNWNPGQVRAHLKATAEQIGSRQLFGQGIVNADAATR